MFTAQQLQTLRDSLELSKKSHQRAKNSKGPQFALIYETILRDIDDIDAILRAELAKLDKIKK